MSFSSIPHRWHMNNGIAGHGRYHANLFYSTFAASAGGVRTEDVTRRCHLDTASVLDERTCLFEYKVVEDALRGAMLAQLRERGYADKHRRPGREMHLVSVEFSLECQELVAYEALRD